MGHANYLMYCDHCIASMQEANAGVVLWVTVQCSLLALQCCMRQEDVVSLCRTLTATTSPV